MFKPVDKELEEIFDSFILPISIVNEDGTKTTQLDDNLENSSEFKTKENSAHGFSSISKENEEPLLNHHSAVPNQKASPRSNASMSKESSFPADKRPKLSSILFVDSKALPNSKIMNDVIKSEI